RPELKRLLDALTGGFFPQGTSFWGIYDAMIGQNDEYFVLRDFESYRQAWLDLDRIYSDRQRFGRMSLANIAGSAFFSSDRTIREYAEDIWHI
ncbi:MAG: glycogen/starch/alpha-glucan phosphorylase, partial [Firmicutes bacterium]|nr:glycogen/starch/alpha-glucan phosphorylase [Bacillota bacterium]